ncbi:MAG: DUF4867 family protein [Chloroflexota bacterium]|nr:DUF4867 family protein [Chloroflexota bacterium]
MLEILNALQAANPALDIRSVSDPRFARYGRLLDGYDPNDVIARARGVLPQADHVVYEPSVPTLEEPADFNTAIEHGVFGGMPVQVGWCYGQNLRMGALEYHKGSEVNVCVTDALLLVGHVQDISFGEKITYNAGKVEAFYAPAGSVVEFPPWNLHFAPIHIRDGEQFATLVYLPLRTNEPLPYQVERVGEGRLLFAINKWLIAHPDAQALIEQGAYPGITGDDIEVTPISE